MNVHCATVDQMLRHDCSTAIADYKARAHPQAMQHMVCTGAMADGGQPPIVIDGGGRRPFKLLFLKAAAPVHAYGHELPDRQICKNRYKARASQQCSIWYVWERRLRGGSPPIVVDAGGKRPLKLLLIQTATPVQAYGHQLPNERTARTASIF